MLRSGNPSVHSCSRSSLIHRIHCLSVFLVVWYATRVFATYLLAMYDAAWYKMTD